MCPCPFQKQLLIDLYGFSISTYSRGERSERRSVNAPIVSVPASSQPLLSTAVLTPSSTELVSPAMRTIRLHVPTPASCLGVFPSPLFQQLPYLAQLRLLFGWSRLIRQPSCHRQQRVQLVFPYVSPALSILPRLLYHPQSLVVLFP